MATSKTRNFDDDALAFAAVAEEYCRGLLSRATLSISDRIAVAQVHATLAVAYSNLGDQS